MTESQKVQLRISEVREQANRLESTDANLPRHEELRGKLADLDAEYRAAIEAETQASDGAFGEDTPENRAVTGKADLGLMVGALVSRRALNVGSAEAEAQAAWGLGGDSIPLAMLAEYRVAGAPADGGGSQGFVGYRFPASVAGFANVSRPRVAPGTPVYPSITAATSASRPAEAAEVTDSDPTLRGELLTPHRVQASTKISVEDRARLILS